LPCHYAVRLKLGVRPQGPAMPLHEKINYVEYPSRDLDGTK